MHRLLIRSVGTAIFLAAAVAALATLSGCEAPGSRILTSYPDPIVDTHPPDRSPTPPLQPPVKKTRRPAGPEAAWVPAKGIRKRWTAIVIHHSATSNGSKASFHRAHRARGWKGLGYHFVIGNGSGSGDGQIEVGFRWHNQETGAHTGGTPGNYYNEHGIGICLVGNFDRTYPTPRQIKSLTRLVAFLCKRCGIKTSRIYTHRGVTHKTRCPGKHFSLTALRSGVKAALAAGEAGSAPTIAHASE